MVYEQSTRDTYNAGSKNRNAFMDGQFEPLRGNLAELGITLNTASNDEHVPEIERQIRTVKERT